MKKIKKTKKLIEKFKPYWKKYKKIEDKYYEAISKLEKVMSEDTKIDDIEIYFSIDDSGAIGIGNTSRTMGLIFREELE